jgi:hypothetical protein
MPGDFYFFRYRSELFFLPFLSLLFVSGQPRSMPAGFYPARLPAGSYVATVATRFAPFFCSTDMQKILQNAS